MLKEGIEKKHVISSWNSLVEYLQVTMGSAPIEMLRILFLNKKNYIIKDELISEGTVDYVAIYPREIAKKVIIYSATAIILVHNHPSGVAKPSKKDIEYTKQLSMALSALDVIIHDHVIVADHHYFSFKSSGLL